MGDNAKVRGVLVLRCKNRDPKATPQQNACREDQQVALPLHVSLPRPTNVGREESSMSNGGKTF